jgi:hypothetical protein
MKNTVEAEDLRNLNYTQFSEPLPGAIELADVRSGIVLHEYRATNTLLDLLVTAVKWTFLFLPGAAAIHFLMMGFGLLYFYDDWSFSLVGARIGILIFSIFMTMLGIGKLSDLRYLRVPASLLAAGGLAAVLYSILIVFIPGDFFGFYAKLTLPLTVFIGYMVKRDTDKKLETD